MEQAKLASRVIVIIEVGKSTESDKVLRASIRFIVLVSKTALKDARVAVLKAEKLHCTWIEDFKYSLDGSTWVGVDVFSVFWISVTFWRLPPKLLSNFVAIFRILYLGSMGLPGLSTFPLLLFQ